MAMDMFLDLGDKIAGESKDHKHKGKIDILAWSWGCSQSGNLHSGGGGGAGKVNMQDLSVTKWIDKSTPVLMLHCAAGTHIPKAKLTVRKAGDKPLEYLVIDLEDLLVSSVSTGGSGGEDKLTENVSLHFAKVKVSYKIQKQDGSGEPGGEFGWDVAANEKV